MNIQADIALVLLTLCGLGSFASAADPVSATIPVNINVQPYAEVELQPFTTSIAFDATSTDGQNTATGVVFPTASATISGKLTCNTAVSLTWNITPPASEPGSSWTVRTQPAWAAGNYTNLGTITIDITGLQASGAKSYTIQNAGGSTAGAATLTLQVSLVNP